MITIINVALLSRWHVHADDYAREAKANEELDIKLVWDEDTKRGRQWAAELGVPFEQNLHAILSSPEIDAVIVTTPTSMHKQVILEAAKQGKHIFTEKVLGITVEDCEAMWKAAETSAVELMVSLPRLSENAFLHDVVILHHDKNELHRILQEIEVFLSYELKLQLNNKTTIRPIKDGIEYVGYRIWPTHRKLHNKTAKKMKKRLLYMQKAFSRGEVNADDVRSTVASYLGLMKHANCYNLKVKMLSNFRLQRKER